MDDRHPDPRDDVDLSRSAVFSSVSAEIRAPASGPRLCPSCGAVYEGDDVFCRVDGTRLRVRSENEDTRVGEVIDGRYTIVGLLGEGAMGTVYRAVQRGLEREVAVKVLKKTSGNERTNARRFLREVRAISRLNHRNIVTVHDFGETPGGELFLAMELLRGATLRQVMDGEGPLAAERAIGIACEVAEGLNAAHAKGIIHRDLKPSNVVVVDTDGVTAQHVKLLDFGLAKWSEADASDAALTRTGHICGTPLYMSPEQALGMELDCRSDVYSLGLLVYEMLVGRQPFSERPVVEILRAHVQEGAPSFAAANPKVRVHQAIEAVVLRSLAKDAGDRPDSALEFKAALESALAQARAASAAANAAATVPVNTVVSRPAIAPPAPPAAAIPLGPGAGAAPAAPEGAAAEPVPAAAPGALAAPPGANAGRRPTGPRPATGTPRPDVSPSVVLAAASPAPASLSVPGLRAATWQTPQPPPRGAAVLRQRSTPEAVPPDHVFPDHYRAYARPAASERVPSDGAPVTRRATLPGLSAPRPAEGARTLPGDSRRGSDSAPGAPQRGATASSDVNEQAAAAERLLAVVGDGPRRPWCELNLADLRHRQGRLADAETHARVALRRLRKDGDVRLEGRATGLLADLAEQAGDVARACDWLQLSVAAWRAAGNAERVAEALARLGGLLYRRQHYPKARLALEAAVKLDRGLGNHERLGANLRGLGAVLEALGKPDESESTIRRALAIEEQRGDPAARALCHHHLGRTAEGREDWAEALRRHEQALSLRREHGDERDVAVSLQHVAVSLVQQERFGDAQVRLEEARAIHERRGDETALALVLRQLGDLSRKRGDWPGATRRYERSEEILRRLGSRHQGARSAFLEAFRPDGTDEALRRALGKADGTAGS